MTISISQLLNDIKFALLANDALQDVWVEGEVSQFTQASSGHCYFKLKDGASSIDCVMWRGQAAFVRKLPTHGNLVVAHGKVDVFPQQGKLQFYVDNLQAAGVGQLNQAFEALKARLSEEGLFEQSRKRAIPAWPQRIGLVTSADAAALRDVLRTLKARFPLADVLLAPCLVQGTEAPAQIVAAIERLNRWSTEREPIDTLIVARGGGSLEELWAFNDERVARALAASGIPTISGVGHETDFTIADFVADFRAPTPTGAATLAVPDQQDLRDRLLSIESQLSLHIERQLVATRRDVTAHQRLLTRVSPEQQILAQRQRLGNLQQRMQTRFENRLGLTRERIAAQTARVEALNPTQVLARGYAIVRSQGGNVVRHAKQVTRGDALRVTVSDGTFNVEVTGDDV